MGTRTDTGTALLQARGVAKSFGGVPALRNGCLELQAGSVHALCGGNGAGKSTFLNIVMGLLRRDAGEILLKGRPVDFATPHEALAHRLSIITQELSPIPGMSVAENIFLGREPRRAGVVVRHAALLEQADALLRQLGFDIDPRAQMGRLSLAQTQLVEIAKALSRQSELIIMDEPTSAIGESETAILFDAIRRVTRSEEHTSELQSPCNLVCRLLLEKTQHAPLTAPPKPPRVPPDRQITRLNSTHLSHSNAVFECNKIRIDLRITSTLLLKYHSDCNL